MDLEEDIMVLKERLMQERNEARQEKVRLEEEIVSRLLFFFIFAIHHYLYQTATTKRYDEQEKANQLLKKYFEFKSSVFLYIIYFQRCRFSDT